MSYSVLTPFILPPEIKHKKCVNIGDGFIFNSLMELLSPHQCTNIYSTRKSLSDDDIAEINTTKALILAGANQLNDTFTIAPKMDLKQLDRIKVPIVPFGIGIYGIASQNEQMSELTALMLREIHSRIEFSSWRCDLTLQYLQRFLPDLRQQFLMTGCPVMYDRNILEGSAFSDRSKSVVVTVTERGDFWQREIDTIDFVSHKYRHSRKILSLHQDFESLQPQTKPKNWVEYLQSKFDRQPPSDIILLRRYARRKGFKIFLPKSVKDCHQLYRQCDLHIGSRVHAHLYFLSQAKKSFLTYVDDRCAGFSQTLSFPICEPQNFADYLDYDFEIYRQKCLTAFQDMQKFVNYLKTQIL